MTPSTHTLKSGETIIIRQAIPDDAAVLLKVVKSYINDSKHMLLTAEEFNPNLAQEIAWIQRLNKSSNSLLLVALHEKQIIGNLDFTGHTRQKLKHTAILGMGILKTWRGKGLGTALLKTAIEWATANEQLEVLCLQVFGTNQAGIHLYQKMGFVENGRQKNFIKIDDNRYEDNVLMSLVLKNI